MRSTRRYAPKPDTQLIIVTKNKRMFLGPSSKEQEYQATEK
jgi:hypothetical protein